MMMASPAMLPTSGFAQKIDRLPCDSSMACRKLASAMSPSTSANTMGASGYLSFLNRYPTTPKTSISQTSNIELCTV